MFKPISFAARLLLGFLAIVGSAGSANAQFNVPNDTICTNCPFPRVADIDQDGRLDLIFTRPAEDTITWMRNQGDGDFTAPQFLATNDHHLTIELVGDADQDGDVDLVGVSLTPTYQDSTVAIIRNNEGIFETEVIEQHVAATRPLTRFADLDGNGELDLLGLPINTSPFGEVWYRHVGTSYVRDTISFWCQQVQGPWAVLDLEGDGDLDLASYVQGSVKRVTALWNLGAGRFGPPTWATPQYLFPLGVRPASDAADVNGDGFTDLVVGGRPCLSQGDGTFLLPASLDPMNYQSIGEADCEPTLEAFVSSTIAQANPGLSELSFTGSFVLPSSLPADPFRSRMMIMDADERPDLLMGPINDALGPVFWRRNNAVPIPMVYEHPVDTITAGPTITVVYPPLDVEDQVPGTDVLADGDWYTGLGVIGDSLYTAQLPEGWLVITANYLSFTSQTGCASMAQDSIYIRNEVGISEASSPRFVLAPNPANDVLRVKQQGVASPRYVVRDPFGRIVNARILSNDRGTDEARIECSGLSAGSYLLSIYTSEQLVKAIPFVVVH